MPNEPSEGLRRQMERALADYNMAIKIDPTHPIHHVSRAMPLNEMGKRADTAAGLKKALAAKS